MGLTVETFKGIDTISTSNDQGGFDISEINGKFNLTVDNNELYDLGEDFMTSVELTKSELEQIITVAIAHFGLDVA